MSICCKNLRLPNSYKMLVGVGALALTLSACSGLGSLGKIDPKYGVAASPRVSKASHTPSGGGRYQVGKPYKIAGRWYKPKEVSSYEKTGVASWYGDAFHGRKTANGEIYNMNAFSAAHPTLPLPSYVRVTNLANKKSVVVRVNDRGPFAHNRLIDLSKRAAHTLDFIKDGTAKVRVSYIGKAPIDGRDAEFLNASIREGGRPTPHALQVASRRSADRDNRRATTEASAPGNPNTSTAVNVAFRKPQNDNGGPLLIWADEVPPVGSGYVSMYSGEAEATNSLK